MQLRCFALPTLTYQDGNTTRLKSDIPLAGDGQNDVIALIGFKQSDSKEVLLSRIRQLSPGLNTANLNITAIRAYAHHTLYAVMADGGRLRAVLSEPVTKTLPPSPLQNWLDILAFCKDQGEAIEHSLVYTHVFPNYIATKSQSNVTGMMVYNNNTPVFTTKMQVDGLGVNTNDNPLVNQYIEALPPGTYNQLKTLLTETIRRLPTKPSPDSPLMTASWQLLKVAKGEAYGAMEELFSQFIIALTEQVTSNRVSNNESNAALLQQHSSLNSAEPSSLSQLLAHLKQGLGTLDISVPGLSLEPAMVPVKA